jgi:hypothetical protein
MEDNPTRFILMDWKAGSGGWPNWLMSLENINNRMMKSKSALYLTVLLEA